MVPRYIWRFVPTALLPGVQRRFRFEIPGGSPVYGLWGATIAGGSIGLLIGLFQVQGVKFPHPLFVARVIDKGVDADRLPDPAKVSDTCKDAGSAAEAWRIERARRANSSAADPVPVSAAVSPAEPPVPVWNAIMAERDRQDAKWGGVPGIDRRDDHTYAAVLGEEFGEVCKAWLERDVAALREELIQTAAVAIAWIEEIDHGGGRPRGR